MRACLGGRRRRHRYQSYQRILEEFEPADAAEAEAARSFQPDGASMAKALGAGVPIGAFWVAEKHADVLQVRPRARREGGRCLVLVLLSISPCHTPTQRVVSVSCCPL